MSIFRKRPVAPDDNPYAGLRAMLLGLDPDSAGIPRHGRVWGALLETSWEGGRSFTLVCLGDGTTSLYTSTGGGVIGAGGHEAVRAANRRFLEAVEGSLAVFGPDRDDALPPPDTAVLRALTYDGRLRAAGPERDLGEGRHPASVAFHAAHAVITELRQVEEGR